MKIFRFVLKWIHQHSLHIRVMLGVVIPIVIVIGAFSYIDYKRRQESTIATLSMFSTHIGEVIHNDLRHQMLESDFDGLQELLVTIGELEGVHAVYLIDTQGEIIFGSDERKIGSIMDNKQPECLACHDFDLSERPKSIIVALQDGERVFRSARIVQNEAVCQECHNEDTEHLGILLTDFSIAPYEATLIRDTRDHFLWWSAALFLTLAVVGLVFNRFVLLRLNALGRHIVFVGKGQRVGRLPDRPRDEIGRIAEAFNKMAEQVEEREADNAKLSMSLRKQSEERGQLLSHLISAQEMERKRVARDLHDVLGQALSGLALRSQATKRLILQDTDKADAQLSEIEALIQDTVEKMYKMILDLRPSVLDDLGLVSALKSHAERIFQPAGIKYSINTDGEIERLPPEIETALYRTFQEALNNIVRHANAANVKINLKRNNGYLEGEIVDDGCGFELGSVDLTGGSKRGLGIIGMRERVTQSGGEMKVITHPGDGTQILISLKIGEDETE